MHHTTRILVGVIVTATMMLVAARATVQAADIQVDAGIGEAGCDLVDAIESANGDIARNEDENATCWCWHTNRHL